MNGLIIAIDGPVGSGKSTVARRVAELLGYTHLDSGAMYRAVAWKALRDRRAAGFAGAAWRRWRRRCASIWRRATENLCVILDGEDITDLIRTPEVSHAASVVAVIPGVRHPMVAEQRRAGSARRRGDGRPRHRLASYFPHADLKIFLDASPEVRAQRRWRELQEKGEAARHSIRCLPKCTNAIAATASARCRRWFAPPMPWWWTTPRWTRKRPRASLFCWRGERRKRAGRDGDWRNPLRRSWRQRA